MQRGVYFRRGEESGLLMFLLWVVGIKREDRLKRSTHNFILLANCNFQSQKPHSEQRQKKPSPYLISAIIQFVKQYLQFMSERLQDTPHSVPKEETPEDGKQTEEEQAAYYSEYCRLYLTNQILITQLKELNFEKSDLVVKLAKLEKRAEQLSQGNSAQIDEKKRRIRRSAVDIARHYKCQVQGCTKSYGSEGSLNQHTKLKHPQLFRGSDFPVKQYDNEDDSQS